ncbi:hypothetical protein LHJ74_24405 [Streptomyces sp. N2-109]|uniref:Lipoprotein n=1 Tax=Streptomyces gossypii TaxID=2883101 RepID=A0ABT2JYP1_9ACTN|nr:hypothetical protein [Streptomyces gossypii]MCT2593017.1 hypothetical protein [Streptomyces gossypii]
MRSTTLRGAVAVAVLIPVLTLSSAACSEGGEKGDGGGVSESGGSGREKPESGEGDGDGRESGPPLTEAQLEKALLKTGEVKGYQAQRNTEDALPPRNTMEPDRPECEAITDTVDSKPKHKRSAYASGLVMGGDFDSGGAIQQVLLAAYRPGEAALWLDELKRALEECRSFLGKAGTGEQAELEIEPGEATRLGDESVQFTMKDAKGRDSPTVFLVVRAGNNTATFMSAGVSGEPVPFARPVVTKQYEKLAAAGGHP